MSKHWYKHNDQHVKIITKDALPLSIPHLGKTTKCWLTFKITVCQFYLKKRLIKVKIADWKSIYDKIIEMNLMCGKLKYIWCILTIMVLWKKKFMLYSTITGTLGKYNYYIVFSQTELLFADRVMLLTNNVLCTQLILKLYDVCH